MLHILKPAALRPLSLIPGFDASSGRLNALGFTFPSVQRSDLNEKASKLTYLNSAFAEATFSESISEYFMDLQFRLGQWQTLNYK